MSYSASYGGDVKHITFGDKSLLVGDEAADELLEYAAFLATQTRGDTVRIRAISPVGAEVTATFLLGPGVTMMSESTHTDIPEPDNADAVAYMALARTRPPAVHPSVPFDDPTLSGYDEFDLDSGRPAEST
jgi:hypothetical protein